MVQEMTWEAYLKRTSEKAQKEGQDYLLIERSSFDFVEYTANEWTHFAVSEQGGKMLALIYAHPVEHEGIVVATYETRSDIEAIHEDKYIRLVER
jgi:hypothetical protein